MSPAGLDAFFRKRCFRARARLRGGEQFRHAAIHELVRFDSPPQSCGRENGWRDRSERRNQYDTQIVIH